MLLGAQKATLAEAKVGTTVSRRTAKKARRKRDAAYAELADRTARADKMKRTGDAMQLQKNLTVRAWCCCCARPSSTSVDSPHANRAKAGARR